jgi:hypothetical protein
MSRNNQNQQNAASNQQSSSNRIALSAVIVAFIGTVFSIVFSYKALDETKKQVKISQEQMLRDSILRYRNDLSENAREIRDAERIAKNDALQTLHEGRENQREKRDIERFHDEAIRFNSEQKAQEQALKLQKIQTDALLNNMTYQSSKEKPIFVMHQFGLIPIDKSNSFNIKYSISNEGVRNAIPDITYLWIVDTTLNKLLYNKKIISNSGSDIPTNHYISWTIDSTIYNSILQYRVNKHTFFYLIVNYTDKVTNEKRVSSYCYEWKGDKTLTYSSEVIIPFFPAKPWQKGIIEEFIYSFEPNLKKVTD